MKREMQECVRMRGRVEQVDGEGDAAGLGYGGHGYFEEGE